jgi:hypothetical protein
MRYRRGGNPPATVSPHQGGCPRASARALRGVLLGVVTVCIAPLACAAAASAANYDVRGEWKYTMTCSPPPSSPSACDASEFQGIAVIKTQEAGGTYSGTQVFESDFPGTVSGTVNDDTLSMVVAITSPPLSFTMPGGVINPATNEFSGSGYYNGGGSSQPTGTLTATRLRTLKQIEEQEEKEKIEREAREKGEKEGRTVGEKEGTEKGEREGRAKGELEGREKGATEGAAKAELEVKQKFEQETKERQAGEARAKTEREAKEKAEKEAAEKADTQAREKIEREAREKVAKEAKERKLAEEAKRKKKPKHKPKHRSGKRVKATHARR